MQESKESASETAARRPRRKLVVAGVVAAVALVACASLWVWHEQPSFCGAICHTPMDPYLSTYEAEVGQEATDKYGNTVEDASGMLAATHRVEAGSSCMDCHVPTMSEQVSEGMSWITGSYTLVSGGSGSGVLEERSMDDLAEARGADGEQFCLNKACHANDDGTAMTRDDLIAATSDLALNPHVIEHDELACTDCHKAHRASVMQCSLCHLEAEIPEGWVRATDK